MYGVYFLAIDFLKAAGFCPVHPAWVKSGFGNARLPQISLIGMAASCCLRIERMARANPLRLCESCLSGPDLIYLQSIHKLNEALNSKGDCEVFVLKSLLNDCECSKPSS